jgi:hypothetical protein
MIEEKLKNMEIRHQDEKKGLLDVINKNILEGEGRIPPYTPLNGNPLLDQIKGHTIQERVDDVLNRDMTVRMLSDIKKELSNQISK